MPRRKFNFSSIRIPYFTQLFFVVTVALISFIPRIIELLTKETFYNGDVAFFLFITRSIVIEHKLPLIGSYVGNIGGFAQSAGWNYLLAIPFVLTNGAPDGAVGLMFIISILTLIIAPIFIWFFWNKWAAVFLLFFLGVSPNLIMVSNRILPPYITPFFTVIYLSFLLLFLVKNKRKYYFLMAISLGLMFTIEIANFGLLFIGFTLLSFYLMRLKLLHFKEILISNGLIFCFFIPHFIYDLFNNFYNIRGVLAVIPFKKAGFIGSNLFSNLLDRLHLFKTDLMSVFPTLHISFLILFLAFISLGLFLFTRDKKIELWKKIFISYIYFTIFLTFGLLLLVPTNHADVWWIAPLTIFYIYLAGIITTYLLFKKAFIFRLLCLVFLILFIRSFLRDVNILNNFRVQKESLTTVIKIQDPIEYIYQDSRSAPFSVLYLTEGNEVLDYKYLFWYLARTKYKGDVNLKSLDLRYTTTGGYRFPLDESKQFNNLKKGIYYLIISNEAIANGYSKKILSNKILGQKLSEKTLNNFVVEKYIINN